MAPENSKAPMAKENGKENGKVTLESVDAKVTEVLALLAELRPYLPLLTKISHLIDNPAARFRAAVRGSR